MRNEEHEPLQGLDEDAALRRILEGTATQTGEGFFRALVEHLSAALHTHGAWVTELVPEGRRLRALAFLMDGEFVRNYEFCIDGTPCATVIDTAQLVHFPDRLVELYPNDSGLREAGFVSYLGVPLQDVDDRCLGHMAVVDRRPMPADPRAIALFRIFAARAAAELQRLRAERDVREREEKLARLFDSAMDAIIEIDDDLRISRANAAAERMFGHPVARIVDRSFREFVEGPCGDRLQELIGELNRRSGGDRSLWIPGGLTARGRDGAAFPAEATLSQFEMHRRRYYTLILRNVHDRLAAERQIVSLTAQTEYLRTELRELQNLDRIVGRSAALRTVLQDVAQVAPTDATVLIVGETGTGKELIARAIHDASPRRDRPLVKVNCAAIPAALIESEFFGHEKGAFTGATERREGRFALADGGTILLDEVGELPVDLQVKLLRVLQEGEFEPVGSSRTRAVDVRVIAATNRNLARAIEEGGFREDLFYRLNVFPIRLPPLRERGDDVVELAEAFARRFAGKLARRIAPLDASAVRRLRAYSWPGNVRELQNVVERAVITSVDGTLNLARALPDVGATNGPASNEAAALPDDRDSDARVRTAEELQQFERENIRRALERVGWKVSGTDGAAALLGMNPSTLNSRMRALGIRRP